MDAPDFKSSLSFQQLFQRLELDYDAESIWPGECFDLDVDTSTSHPPIDCFSNNHQLASACRLCANMGGMCILHSDSPLTSDAEYDAEMEEPGREDRDLPTMEIDEPTPVVANQGTASAPRRAPAYSVPTPQTQVVELTSNSGEALTTKRKKRKIVSSGKLERDKEKNSESKRQKATEETLQGLSTASDRKAKSLSKSATNQSDQYHVDIPLDSICTSKSIWQGLGPPSKEITEIKEMWEVAILWQARKSSEGIIAATTGVEEETPKLIQILQEFYRLYYHHSHTFITERDGMRLIARTKHIQHLEVVNYHLSEAIDKLLHKDLTNPSVVKKNATHVRGHHYPGLMGPWRQSMKLPSLTSWHKQNKSKVDEFVANEHFQLVNQYVGYGLRMHFNQVYWRYMKCIKYHKKNYPNLSYDFGPFFNLCINGIFPDATPGGRIFCKPHIDRKNPVGICALYMYCLPGYEFKYGEQAWLVIWELGLIIQIPPGVVLYYPSSLFFHFNIDITHIKFVVTGNFKQPTPDECQELGECKGRGSMVWFNMATMFQVSELGCSVKEAKAAGAGTASAYKPEHLFSEAK